MQSFDVRTLILVAGILYMVMPAFAWVSLRALRVRAVAYWCLGGLAIGAGAILAAVTGRAPALLPYQVILCLFTLSHALRIQALLTDLGRPWPWRWLVLAAALAMALVNAVRYGLGDAVLAAQLNNAIAAACFFYVGYLAWQIARAETSRSALWIAIVYLLVSLAFAWRVLALPFAGGNADMVVNQVASGLIAFAGMLSAVIGHFGYVGLSLERALRHEFDSVAKSVREHEEDRLSAHFNQFDKQRSMGELSASLAHELSQPLTAILTNAQVIQLSLRKAPPDAGFMAGLLAKIARSTERAHKILQATRASIQLPASSPAVVDLNQVLREVVTLLDDPLRAQGIALTLDLSATPAWVRVDPVQASQVVLNLFQNAIESLAGVQERQLVARTALQDGHAVLWLRDTGAGLTATALQSAGEAFFTTKSFGLGMGLSISRAIVAQFNGSLRLANASTEPDVPLGLDPHVPPGRGAVAELRFPLHPGWQP